MMIDKRLINTVADSKKWIGITVLWNWVALIGGIISAVVFSYILQAAYFNELGPISAVIFGIVLVAALALRAFAGKKSVQASYFARSFFAILFTAIIDIGISGTQISKITAVLKLKKIRKAKSVSGASKL